MTKYPDSHDIQSFLNGHREFVSSVAFLNNDQSLISASGDKTVRLWDVEAATELQRIEMPYVPITIQLSERFMAIASEDHSLYVYSYEFVDSKIKINLLGEKSYGSDFHLTIRGNTFFVLHVKIEDLVKQLYVDKFASTAESPHFEFLCDVPTALEVPLYPSFKITKPYEVALMFKKRHDNSKEYLERKKARIMEIEARQKRLKRERTEQQSLQKQQQQQNQSRE